MKLRLIVAAVFSLIAGVATVLPATAVSPRPDASGAARSRQAVVTPNGAWTVYHHDDAHTGYDSTQPNAVTAVAGWTSTALDESVYGEPLVYQGLVYVATLNNTVYALNQTDGSVVWSNHLGAPETTGWMCGNVSPQGILGTPVIDPATGRIYVVVLGTDDIYRVAGLNLTTGVEDMLTVVTTPATGFDWTIEQQRGALAVANGHVYVPFGGRAGDCGSYHGYIFAVPTNGAAVTHYYATPGQGAGFWTAGGVVVDDSTGKVFDTSGNGTASGCDANGDGTPTYENDAVVRLSSTLAHEDAFIPLDWQNNWCNNDQDLGSASMVLISPTLAFQAGKWGNGFLVNPQTLGGMDGQRYPTPQPATYAPVDVCMGNHQDANFGSYAYAAPYVYLSCDANTGIGFSGRLVGLSVNTSTPSFSACDSTCGAPSWNAGSTTFGPPIVAGGAVWVVAVNGGGLYGFDAATGAQIYHSAGFSATHFTTPSEAGGQIFVGSGNVVRSFNMVSGCRSVAVTTTPSGTASVGTAVTVTASASGCPHPNPLYEFWTLAPGATTWQLAQPYSTMASLSWLTMGKATGTWGISVWARDASSAGAYGNSSGRWDAYNSSTYALVAPACTGLGVSVAPPSSTTVGASVLFTATGVCPDPNPVYQFWRLAPGASTWTLAQAYSTTRTFNWATTGAVPGTYGVSVWVRDASGAGVFSNSSGSWDAYSSSTYAVTTCAGLSASSAPPSTTSVGATVVFTATAAGCPSPNPEYEFWMLAPGASSWTQVQAYSTTRTFSWATAGKVPGSYRVSVWVRDASSAGAFSNSAGSWDAYSSSTYTLTACSSVSVSSAPPGTTTVGSPVSFNATGGCPNPNPVYEFWILAPGSSTWTLGQAYSTSPSFNWSTTGKAAGSYAVSVWVRDASSAGAFSNASGSWDAYSSTTYTLTIRACTGLGVTSMPAATTSVGTSVTFTAAGTCPDAGPVYEFWILAPGSSTWTLGQAYSTSPSFAWSTTGRPVGGYHISVWVRDASSPGAFSNASGSWDAYNSSLYTLT